MKCFICKEEILGPHVTDPIEPDDPPELWIHYHDLCASGLVAECMEKTPRGGEPSTSYPTSDRPALSGPATRFA